MRIGFVRLIDAAPVIVAQELGYFFHEGLQVVLEPQFDWLSLRDNISSGFLDAALAALGSPIMSQLGRAGFVKPLVGVMNVGAGGDSMVISRDLARAGAADASTLGELVRSGQITRKLICAHPSPYSANHYLLREWLWQGGLNPDQDVQLIQITTAQAAEHLARHYVDVFCIAEPWGMLADQSGWGKLLCATADVMADHPEKILVVTEAFAQTDGEKVRRLIRAILKGCRYCQQHLNSSKHKELARLLFQSGYLNQDADVIEASLAIDAQNAGTEVVKQRRPANWRYRSWADEFCHPSTATIVWFIKQMVRWGELSDQVDVDQLSQRCLSGEFFRHAVNSMDTAFVPAAAATQLSAAGAPE